MRVSASLNFQPRRHFPSAQASCVPCTCRHLGIIGRLRLAALRLEPCTIDQDRALLSLPRGHTQSPRALLSRAATARCTRKVASVRRSATCQLMSRFKRSTYLERPARSPQHWIQPSEHAILSTEHTGFPPGPHEQRWSSGTPARHCSICWPVVAHTHVTQGTARRRDAGPEIQTHGS